ncbi:MAG: glycolate oxidase subunit GlcE [Burkholderiales bacterium]
MTTQALHDLIDRVLSAGNLRQPVHIQGGGSKDFYGEVPSGVPLSMAALQGISSYEPSELVVTVRAGTPLAELEEVLAAHGQYLAFEPPRFSPHGTIGGMVAAGLSGPSRASVGSLRDFVLGVSILNGRAQVLNFGGRVIKNVAGYDVSRLMCGAMGTLGLILEVSLKVLPLPTATATLRFALDEPDAIQKMNLWAAQPLAIHATAWAQGQLYLRLSGASAAVTAAVRQLSASHGGTLLEPEVARLFWASLRDQTAPFFQADPQRPLWRLSVPSAASPLPLPEDLAASENVLIEWGGAQRWWRTHAPAIAIRKVAEAAGGHATLFRSNRERREVFTPLSGPVEKIHRALKQSFDPEALFNPGRMYPGL